IEITLPIVEQNVVRASSQMVTYPLEKRMFGLWHFIIAQRVKTIQIVNWAGVLSSQEFAVRIGPLIFARASDVERAGRDHGQQHMLVDRELVFASVVAMECLAKPVREAQIDRRHSLAKDSA